MTEPQADAAQDLRTPPDGNPAEMEPRKGAAHIADPLSVSAAPAYRGTEIQGDAVKALTFAEFSLANRTRCESPAGFHHPLNGWSSSDWMTALVGEVGEAANVVKKLNRVRDGVPGNKATPEQLRDQLRQELGDVFVYLDLRAQSLGFSIAAAAVEVFNAKSRDIGYPAALAALNAQAPDAVAAEPVAWRWQFRSRNPNDRPGGTWFFTFEKRVADSRHKDDEIVEPLYRRPLEASPAHPPAPARETNDGN